MAVTWPPSLWAHVSPPGPELPELDGAQEAEVAVIGAGFTGLSTAIHLREMGIPVTVVEAAEPGWGASGRNNGQVIPTLSRHDPAALIARHGAAGERFVHVLRDSASTLFDLVRRHGIEAEAEQEGWIQPVHSPFAGSAAITGVETSAITARAARNLPMGSPPSPRTDNILPS